MDKSARIFVAGHRGLVGSALVRRLRNEGYDNLLFRTRQELDLTDGPAVARFFADERPDYVIDAAAKVGGIVANNTYGADFIRENLAIQTNIIHEAWRTGAKRLLFLGSTCIYPKHAPQPMKEEHLLTGPLEPTNEPYAVAKIAGVTMCRAYRRQYGARFLSAMPTNLYGPNDNFDLENSHVLPALLRKFHEAKEAGHDEVVVWGSGKPFREFLHVDDLAEGCIHLLNLPDTDFDRLLDEEPAPGLINIGSGEEVSIAELAGIVSAAVGYRGKIVFDASRPDGTPRKLSDVSKIARFGWQRKITLADGVRGTYLWYLKTLQERETSA